MPTAMSDIQAHQKNMVAIEAQAHKHLAATTGPATAPVSQAPRVPAPPSAKALVKAVALEYGVHPTDAQNWLSVRHNEIEALEL